MKRCPKCGESKPVDDFPRNARAKDGRHVHCKTCRRKDARSARNATGWRGPSLASSSLPGPVRRSLGL